MIQSKKVIALMLGASYMITTTLHGMFLTKIPKKIFKSSKSTSSSPSSYKKMTTSDYDSDSNADNKNIAKLQKNFASALKKEFKRNRSEHYLVLPDQTKRLMVDEILYQNNCNDKASLQLHTLIKEITEQYVITDYSWCNVLLNDSDQPVLFLFSCVEKDRIDDLIAQYLLDLKNSLQMEVVQNDDMLICYKNDTSLCGDQCLFKITLQQNI